MRGISPVVAVVLLIAISVIAAVGLYYWVGGLTTKQQTPEPPAPLTSEKVRCTGDNITVLISNLDPSKTVNSQLFISDDEGKTIENNTAVNINPGNTQLLVFDPGNFTSGREYTIFGNKVGISKVVC